MYLLRSEGCRGLVSIEVCVSDEMKSLALYALGSHENLVNAETAELKLKNLIDVQDRQDRWKKRLVEWEEKTLHGQFLRELESTVDGNRWEWFKRVQLKHETKILLFSTQKQVFSSTAQLIRQMIPHYVDSVMKRQKL